MFFCDTGFSTICSSTDTSAIISNTESNQSSTIRRTEEWPHTHLAQKKISKQTGISRSSIRSMVKKRTLKEFRRSKTPQMSDRTRNRRETRAGSLRERLEINIRTIGKTVW